MVKNFRQLEFTFDGIVRVYSGASTWYFVNLPKELSDEINALFADQKRGFGSLPVEAILNDVVWVTSIFPDSQSRTFMLPLKANVRNQAKIVVGSRVKVSLKIKV